MAKGDADCLVGDDTDLLFLLLHHAKQTGHNLFLCNQGKRRLSGKLWNIFLAVHVGIATTSKTFLFTNVFLEIKGMVRKKNDFDDPEFSRILICSFYRVSGRILHLAQEFQLMNEKTKHNVLDVMATAMLLWF